MSEKLYEDGSIIVDETRYVVDGTTYPINSIASVSTATIVYDDEHTGSWPHLIGSAIVGAILMFSVLGGGGFVAFIISLIAFGYAYMMKPKVESFANEYCVEISTSAGVQKTYTTHKKKKIIEIVEAINTAIIKRG